MKASDYLARYLDHKGDSSALFTYLREVESLRCDCRAGRIGCRRRQRGRQPRGPGWDWSGDVDRDDQYLANEDLVSIIQCLVFLKEGIHGAVKADCDQLQAVARGNDIFDRAAPAGGDWRGRVQ